jgi:cation transport ATPase
MLISCVVVLSACSLDKRLYRNGFLVEFCQHKNVVENSEKLENPSPDDAEVVAADSSENGKSISIVENDPIIDENTFSANYNADFITVSRTCFAEPSDNRPSQDDTSKVHPILIGASVGALLLTSVFTGTLIYNLVIGMVSPYWFPFASLFAVLIWITVFIAFLIGKKIVKKSYGKWRQSKFVKTAFAILLALGVVYIVFIISYIFYFFLYLL